MSREYSGTAQFHSSTPAYPGTPLTIAAWFNPDNADDSMMVQGWRNDTERHFLELRGNVGGDLVRMQVKSSATTLNVDSGNGFTADSWQSIVGISAADDDHIVVLNGDWPNRGTDNTSVTPVPGTGFLIGSEEGGDLMNGSIAEVAVWTVAFTEQDVDAWHSRFSALLIHPDSLLFYARMIRDEDVDIIGGLALTPTGSPTVDTHPSIIYPAMPYIITAPAAAAVTEELFHHRQSIAGLQGSP